MTRAGAPLLEMKNVSIVRGENLALGGIPLKLIHEPSGLVRTVEYLDAARARI